jgi:hypothetical protein
MQFRKAKGLKCAILRDTNPISLEEQIEKFSEGKIFEDLQYSSTYVKVNIMSKSFQKSIVEYSVFILYKSEINKKEK